MGINEILTFASLFSKHSWSDVSLKLHAKIKAYRKLRLKEVDRFTKLVILPYFFYEFRDEFYVEV